MGALQAFQQAIALHNQGRLWEAAQLYENVLKADDRHFGATYRLGLVRLHQRKFDDAERLFRRATKVDKRSVEAQFHLAAALTGLDRLEEAIRHYEKTLLLKPGFAEAHNNLGYALQKLGRNQEAAGHYEKALAINPGYAEARNNLGNALQMLERSEEAVVQLEKAIAIRPNYAEAHNNLGNVLGTLGRNEEAIAHYEKALAAQPSYTEAYHGLGNALEALKRHEEAIAQYEKALSIAPNHAEAHNSLGGVLGTVGRLEEAIAHFQKALSISPAYAAAYVNLGRALAASGRHEEGIAQYNNALALSPRNSEALIGRGNALEAINRLDEALASFDMALSIEPTNSTVFNKVAVFAGIVCDWTRTAKLSPQVITRVAQGEPFGPFAFLGYCGDPALQLACAKAYVRSKVPAALPRLCKGQIWRNEKIRIAYVAKGFHQHPNAYLTAELFEIHDRSRFEVLGISLGPDDRSEMRARLVRAFDRFFDVRSKSDRDVAMLMHDMRVDIAIDRSGYTTDARPGIFAHRPAPIQASYIGSPASLGADFYDYVIADPIVLPFDQQKFYMEKIVHLPECYLVNDSKKVIAANTPTRREVGLPAQGFVFCCFNNTFKITAPVFDVWMRLLRKVDGSALWLFRSKNGAETNLRKEAAARGIDPARLVFAEHVPLEHHLARHRLAGLSLDTLPYNGHTTASDALWAGLPLVTCRGQCFAARVAASLLSAIGLPELITENLEEYEALALRLATEPAFLGAFRERLRQNRLVYPLFDTDRYRRHIEAAYTTMWELWQRGESPRSFAVEPLPGGVIGT